nr:S4 domain-containing protein [Saccharofermentans sp.]
MRIKVTKQEGRLDAYIVSKVTKQEGRLDAYIVSKVEGYSRSFLSSLISQGKVLVNGAPSKASYKPSVGDVIEISIPEPVMDETTPQDIPLDIVYED